MKKRTALVILAIILLIDAIGIYYWKTNEEDETNPQPPVSEQTTEGTQLSTDPVTENTDEESTTPEPEDIGTIEMDMDQFYVLCERSISSVWSNLGVLNSNKDHLSLELEYLELNVESAGYTYNEAYKVAYTSWRNENHANPVIDVKFNADTTKINSATIKDVKKVYTEPCIYHGEVWDYKNIDIRYGDSEYTKHPSAYQAVVGYSVSDCGSMISFVHDGVTYYTPISNVSYNISSGNIKYALGLNDVFKDVKEDGTAINIALSRSAMAYSTPDIQNTENSVGVYPSGTSLNVLKINEEHGIVLVVVQNGKYDIFLFIDIHYFDDNVINTIVSTPITNNNKKRDEDEDASDEMTGDGSDGSNGNNNSGGNNNNGGNNSGGNSGGSNSGGDGYERDENGNLVSNGESIGDPGGTGSAGKGSDGTVGQDYSGLRIG